MLKDNLILQFIISNVDIELMGYVETMKWSILVIILDKLDWIGYDEPFKSILS